MTDQPNKYLAETLVLVVTFQNKIEELKVKLSSFTEFSPEEEFNTIDIDGKGYIGIEVSLILSQDLIQVTEGKV